MFNTFGNLKLCVGVPDLVPDQYRFRSSLETRFWVDRIPLYYLSCALEEGCLSSSAVGAETSETRYVYIYIIAVSKLKILVHISNVSKNKPCPLKYGGGGSSVPLQMTEGPMSMYMVEY